MNKPSHYLNRRNFVAANGALAGATLFPAVSPGKESLSSKGKVEHVISIWLGGGMGQIDTFDPKRKGQPAKKIPGSYYDSIETAVRDVRVCKHFKQLAPLMDRVTAVRTVHHDTIDEHAAATNRMHTGRKISGTITYPSIGSIIAHEKGPVDEFAPPYVVVGYPNVTRGPGFLGPKAGFLYLTQTNQGPAGLTRPKQIGEARQERRKRLLKILREQKDKKGDPKIAEYESAIQQSLKLGGPEFSKVFDLNNEPKALREKFGGEFGQRCLLGRRLIERGVRFVEIAHNLNFFNGTGWDVHFAAIEQQHKMIAELDTAVSALMVDLENKKLLDKTLIMITTEFGRPPEFDSGGGRGHQGSAFSCVLAGGGLNHQGAYGETDELAKKVVSNPVGVPDFFATVLNSVGIDPTEELFDGDRPVPVTDNGKVIESLFQ